MNTSNVVVTCEYDGFPAWKARCWYSLLVECGLNVAHVLFQPVGKLKNKILNQLIAWNQFLVLRIVPPRDFAASCLLFYRHDNNAGNQRNAFE